MKKPSSLRTTAANQAAEIILSAGRKSRRLQIASRGLAGTTVGFDIEADLLAFDEAAHASALNRAYVNENILAAVIRLNKSIAFLVIEEFHSTYLHRKPFHGRLHR